MKKIGIISDSHTSDGNISKLDKALKMISADYDSIVHCGDFTSSATVSYIETTLGIPLIGVAGNMDGMDIKSVFPHKRSFRVEKIKIGIIHGWGTPYDLIERVDKEFDDEDIVIFGHTHIPCDEDFNGRRFLNPGSVTQSRNGLGESIGILEINGKKADFRIQYL